MQSIVDEYIKVGGIFFLGSDQDTEVIYVFMKRDNTPLIHGKSVSTFPVHPSYKLGTVGPLSPQYFGGKFNNKIIIGYDYSTEHHILSGTTEYHTHMYNSNNDTWCIQNPMWCIQDPSNWSPEIYTQRSRYIVCQERQWCKVSQNELILLRPNNSESMQYLQILNIDQSVCLSQKLYFPSELSGIKQATLIGGEHCTIMLIGGLVKKEGRYLANEFIWKGMVEYNRENIIWGGIPVEGIKARLLPICFKLKDNLYICGGVWSNQDATRLFTCCDMYNLKDMTYHKSIFRLPYPLYRNGITFVATDVYETFAIIVGENDRSTRGGIIVFTEKEGFREMAGNPDPQFRKRILFRLK